MKMSAYNRLVEDARKFNNLGLLKAHEALTNDNPDVPDSVLENALYNARGMYKQHFNYELERMFYASEEFEKLEKLVFDSIDSIVVLHFEFSKMHNLSATQKEEIFVSLTKRLTNKLFKHG